MIEHYKLRPEDMEPDNPDMVTEDAIRRYIAKTITGPYGDTYWDPAVTNNITINSDNLYQPNTWISPGVFVVRGEWYLDGSTLDIMVYDEQDV